MNLRTVEGLAEGEVCWTYDNPSDSHRDIAGHVSFYAGRVEACYVDGERIQPQAGSFYGGWITAGIEGPFKGEPGTLGW